MEKKKTKHYLAIKLNKKERDERLQIGVDTVEIEAQILLRGYLMIAWLDGKGRLVDLSDWRIYDLNKDAMYNLWGGEWAKFPYCGKMEWFIDG